MVLDLEHHRVRVDLTRYAGVAILFVGILAGEPSSGIAEPISVPSVLLRLIEEVDVPARQAGVLKEVAAREGAAVQEGSLLAQIDDTQARLTLQRGQLELELAQKQCENDIRVRYSSKSFEVAKAELRRAEQSERKYAKSVSQSELEQLALALERTGLEIEQARHELDLAQAERRLKQNQVAISDWDVASHRVLAPIPGVVAQVHKHVGEWVEPGEKVVRLVRMDRLRAEGFVSVNDLQSIASGARVKLVVPFGAQQPASVLGEVVFLSPEVDAVNSQIRIWAEIDNHDLRLRPGMRAAMTIGE
jgi:macrolide-specific efflux system membrane fusion protein